jgi:hypothetical protein
MNGRGFPAAAAICLILLGSPAHAQVDYRPAPTPLVTAEHAPWYLAGDPMTHAGAIYYPAGPQIHFLPFEMVRSGFYEGIPLYVRTTLEPNSVIFVPVGRGLMQPYERRRDGDLAGTVGSQAPSFPVARRAGAPPGVPQAAAPPTQAPVYFPDTRASSLGRDWPAPAATTGPPPAVAAAAVPARRPGPRDGIFIEFQGARWYSASAAPVHIDQAALARVGERHGMPLYRRAGDPAIYVPVSLDAAAPLARYVRR